MQQNYHKDCSIYKLFYKQMNTFWYLMTSTLIKFSTMTSSRRCIYSKKNARIYVLETFKHLKYFNEITPKLSLFQVFVNIKVVIFLRMSYLWLIWMISFVALDCTLLEMWPPCLDTVLQMWSNQWLTYLQNNIPVSNTFSCSFNHCQNPVGRVRKTVSPVCRRSS